ncbi:hypothetical protein ES708_27984 [subsurface metagenome]
MLKYIKAQVHLYAVKKLHLYSQLREKEECPNQNRHFLQMRDFMECLRL